MSIHTPRPLEDWADLKYVPGSAIAHVVAFGDQHPLCGDDEQDFSWGGWHGTGSFEEIEHARGLARCTTCHEMTQPTPRFNEFTAPSPLYAHTIPEDN